MSLNTISYFCTILSKLSMIIKMVLEKISPIKLILNFIYSLKLYEYKLFYSSITLPSFLNN